MDDGFLFVCTFKVNLRLLSIAFGELILYLNSFVPNVNARANGCVVRQSNPVNFHEFDGPPFLIPPMLLMQHGCITLGEIRERERERESVFFIVCPPYLLIDLMSQQKKKKKKQML